MDKVTIKRVKRNKKEIGQKEKILAGLGVGSALMGAAAVAPKSTENVIVSTAKQGSATSKIKAEISKIFGNIFNVQEAKAASSEEGVDTAAAGAAGQNAIATLNALGGLQNLTSGTAQATTPNNVLPKPVIPYIVTLPPVDKINPTTIPDYIVPPKNPIDPVVHNYVPPAPTPATVNPGVQNNDPAPLTDINAVNPFLNRPKGSVGSVTGVPSGFTVLSFPGAGNKQVTFIGDANGGTIRVMGGNGIFDPALLQRMIAAAAANSGTAEVDYNSSGVPNLVRVVSNNPNQAPSQQATDTGTIVDSNDPAPTTPTEPLTPIVQQGNGGQATDVSSGTDVIVDDNAPQAPVQGNGIANNGADASQADAVVSDTSDVEVLADNSSAPATDVSSGTDVIVDDSSAQTPANSTVLKTTDIAPKVSSNTINPVNNQNPSTGQDGLVADSGDVEVLGSQPITNNSNNSNLITSSSQDAVLANLPAPSLQMPTGNQVPGLQMNNLSNNAPVAPVDNSTSSQYLVKKNDSLWSIATKYYGDGTKWRQIMAANSSKIKTPRSLRIGTLLTIPQLKQAKQPVLNKPVSFTQAFKNSQNIQNNKPLSGVVLNQNLTNNFQVANNQPAKSPQSVFGADPSLNLPNIVTNSPAATPPPATMNDTTDSGSDSGMIVDN